MKIHRIWNSKKVNKLGQKLFDQLYNHSQNIWDKLKWNSALWEMFNFSIFQLFQLFQMFQFLLVLTKFSFREEDWALHNSSMKSGGFLLDTSKFPKILSLNSFSSSWGNWYNQFITNNHASFQLWWKENLLNH